MAESPRRAFPTQYRPSDLDLRLEVSFTDRDGTTHALPGSDLVAGRCGTWVFRVVNRARDLGPGAVVHLVRMNYQVAYSLQTERPKGRDYTTLEWTGEARLRLASGNDAVNLFSVVVEEGPFARGDVLVVRVGDRRRGGAGSEVFWSTTTGTFLLAVDPDGGGLFRGVRDDPVSFRVVADPEPRLLRLLGPTVARVDEPFAMHLGVFDRNRNLVEGYEGGVVFEVPEGMTGLPAAYAFTPEDRGLRIFEGVRVRRPGVWRVRVSGDGVPGTVLANPTVGEASPRDRVYWGDVHAHGWGDSTMFLMHRRTEKLDPASRHLQGHRIGRFDFSCPGAMSMDPGERAEVWEAYREACARTENQGRYVPLLGYEAHPAEGDRQVIFRDFRTEEPPPPMRMAMAELDSKYGGRDDVLLEVHIGGDPPHWDRYLPARERFVEVCSGFGCGEWLLQRALRHGYRPAVCGASDLHLGLMGGPRAVEPFRGRFGQKFPMRQRDSAYGQGPVTAIVAPELDRDGLWEAIQSRRTYATSGARIYLAVTSGRASADGEAALEGGLDLSIRCHACAPLARVDLIVGERRLRTWQPDGLDFREDLKLGSEDLPGDWIYVRVEQRDGEYAWSSPMFLKRSGPLPPGGHLPGWNEDGAEPDHEGQEEAARHLADLLRYLDREEDPERFREIRPAGMLDHSAGRCALFYCAWGEKRMPMSIRWFHEFDIPRIRYDLGHRDYGACDEMDLGPELMARYRDKG